MFNRRIRPRALLAPLMALLAAQATASTQLTVENAEASVDGRWEQTVWVEAGLASGGHSFVVVPGRPRLGRAYDRLAGELNERGRAVFTFAPGRRELLATTNHRVLILDASGEVIDTVTSKGQSLAALGSSSTASVSPTGISSATTQQDVDPVNPLRVTLPREGAQVGSPSIDVRGRLGGILNRPDTRVTVNGISAEVFPSPGGIGRFLVPNLELGNGANNLVVVASSADTTFRQDVGVSLTRVTSNNVVIEGGRAYASRGTAGFSVMNLVTREFQNFAPPAGTNRIDDVCIADGFLFMLDAASGGRLVVMSLANPNEPTLISGPVTVPVGPFAGVSAGGGRVVVSGGTGLLTVRNYNTGTGALGASVASFDAGIGQPDVLVSPDGSRAFISTDFAGSVGGAGFGITTIALNNPPIAPTLLSRTGLPGSGFTAGNQSPANFPIESAIVNGLLVTAHGGGLSRIDMNGNLLGTSPLGFSGVNVDDAGDSLFIVGAGRNVAEMDLSNPASPSIVSSDSFLAPGAFSGVSAGGVFVAIASNAGGLRVLRR